MAQPPAPLVINEIYIGVNALLLSDSELSSTHTSRPTTAPPTPRPLHAALFQSAALRRANPGRRKLRRWRLDDYHLERLDEDELHDFESVNVEWRPSSIGDLVGEPHAEKAALRELVRNGAVPTPAAAKTGTVVAGGAAAARPWAREEARFSMVERRTRQLATRAMHSPSLQALIGRMELFLTWFLRQSAAAWDTSSSAPMEVPSHVTEAWLTETEKDAAALALDAPRCTMGGDLRLALPDSSFQRLLLHALCQFYGLRSKSTRDAPAGGASATCAVLVRRPLSPTPALADLSMVGFLLATRVGQTPAARLLAEAAAVGAVFAHEGLAAARTKRAGRAAAAEAVPAGTAGAVAHALRPTAVQRRSPRSASPRSEWVLVGSVAA